MIRTLLKPLSFLPALMLMYMIYSFSAQPGEVSSQLSYKVSYKIIETADYVFDGDHEDWQIAQWADKINFITRKLAHMTEYFLLAVAVSFPLYVYGLHGILLMLVTGIICVGFACGDEYHQSFVAGRSPAVKDVCIDSVGVFFGVILVRIIGWTGRKTIFRPRPKKKADGKKFRLFGRRKDDPEEYDGENQGGYVPYGNPPYGAAPYRNVPYGNPRQGNPAPRPSHYDGKAPYGRPNGEHPRGEAYGAYPPPPEGSYKNGSYQAPPEGFYENGPYQAPPDGYYENGPYQAPPDGFYENGPYQAPPDGFYENGPYQAPPDGYYENGPHPIPPEEQAPKKKKEKDWLFDDLV